MKHLSDLDFAIDRPLRKRRRQMLLAALGLGFGLQIGVTVWRFQSLDDTRAALQMQQRQLQSKQGRGHRASLSGEQVKVALSAQAMLDSLMVPWEELLSAIEAARTPRILVEAIQPHATDGTVGITVSSPDFATLAEFIQGLENQDAVQGVMLVSESLLDNGGGHLRAVISAKWRHEK